MPYFCLSESHFQGLKHTFSHRLDGEQTTGRVWCMAAVEKSLARLGHSTMKINCTNPSPDTYFMYLQFIGPQGWCLSIWYNLTTAWEEEKLLVFLTGKRKYRINIQLLMNKKHLNQSHTYPSAQMQKRIHNRKINKPKFLRMVNYKQKVRKMQWNRTLRSSIVFSQLLRKTQTILYQLPK